MNDEYYDQSVAKMQQKVGITLAFLGIIAGPIFDYIVNRSLGNVTILGLAGGTAGIGAIVLTKIGHEHEARIALFVTAVMGSWSVVLLGLGGPYQIIHLGVLLFPVMLSAALDSRKLLFWAIGINIVGIIAITAQIGLVNGVIGVILSLGFMAVLEPGMRVRAESRVRIKEATATVQRKNIEISGLLHGIPYMFVAIDEQSRVAFGNERVMEAATTNLGKEFELGTPILDYVPKEHRAKVWSFICRVRDSGTATIEATIDDALGARVIRVNGARMDGYGGGSGCTFLIEDVSTEAREREAQMMAWQQKQRIQTLEEVGRMRQEILNSASHELNTPLTPLKVQLKVLRKQLENLGDEGAVHSMDVLDRNTERLTHLVHDMLDVAKIHAGEMKFELQEVEMSGIITHALEKMQGAARARNLKMASKISGQYWVQSDAKRMQQVVEAVIENAIKFSDEGGQIAVHAKAENENLVVSVRDDGIGIPQEKMARIFSPFGQVSENPAKYGGSGLGLYICKGIVEASGGTINVSSAGKGTGTEFTVTLPLDAQAKN